MHRIYPAFKVYTYRLTEKPPVQRRHRKRDCVRLKGQGRVTEIISKFAVVSNSQVGYDSEPTGSLRCSDVTSPRVMSKTGLIFEGRVKNGKGLNCQHVSIRGKSAGNSCLLHHDAAYTRYD